MTNAMNNAMNNEPAIHTASIASSAMLVELTIGQWTANKLDKSASAEVTTNKRAEKNAARVHKSLLADSKELKAITKHVSAVRVKHKEMTLPWSNMGARIVTTKQYTKYVEYITDAETQFWTLVNNFLQVYSWEVQRAQLSLGDLFNNDDYPSEDKVRAKFRFSWSPMPIPEVGDFRVDIQNEALAQAQQQYAAYYETQFKSAMDDVWERTYKALSNMSERLDYTSKDDKKVFRDSLVGNVEQIAELLDVANITGDVRMTELRRKLVDALKGVTPAGLRTNESLRIETKKKVDEAIAALPSLDF